MKTLIAAVIASAVSFGAFAQTAATPAASPTPATSPTPMAAPAAKPMADTGMKKAPAHKATKKHATKKSSKKAMAPAA